MSALKSIVPVLACLCLSLACGDNNMGIEDVGADGAVASVPDAAQPIAIDASPPAAPDAAIDDMPGDFPIELACSLDDVQPIIECVADNCLDSIADGTLLTCVTFSCGLLLLTTPPECTQCIFAGIANPSSALDACVSGLEDIGGGFPMPPTP